MGRALNIVIIAAVDLPDGSGDSTRLKTMAGALKAGGHKVSILLENPSGNIDEHLLKTEGMVNGIPFKYILGNTKSLQGVSFFTSKYKAVRLLMRHIKYLHEREGIDVVWFNQLAFHTIYFLTRLCRKLGIKTVQSYEDERVKGNGLKRKLIYTNQVMADKYMSRHADAIVAISYYLQDKYQKLTHNKVPITIIPTVVDTRKWDVGPENENQIPILLYYGGFFGFDEIEKMIYAVRILKDRGVSVIFYLVGYNKRKPAYMEDTKNLVQQLNLSDEVEFKGFTPQDKLGEYLQKSNVLLGLRKDDEWSQTGLSTKLSEYLATGRMVICTAIGDNSKYLKNGESAILLPPGCTIEQLADAIQMALSNNATRKEIGEKGRKVALENFDTEVVKNKLDDMLQNIFKSRH